MDILLAVAIFLLVAITSYLGVRASLNPPQD